MFNAHYLPSKTFELDESGDCADLQLHVFVHKWSLEWGSSHCNHQCTINNYSLKWPRVCWCVYQVVVN